MGQVMKKTDLEKQKALKLEGRMTMAGRPSRFGGGAAAVPDRREQRKADQALGLVPFAVKLPAELAQALRERAVAEDAALNTLVADLLRKGLEG